MNRKKLNKFPCQDLFMEHSRNRFVIFKLHCFWDSSLQAYSSVIYIRVITNLDVKVNLICSKTKLYQ